MQGSAALRTGITPGGALAGPWVRNPLWTAAQAVPSLDLRFADNKSLTDATTGQNLVTFTRASSGTYVDSQGVIRTATTNLLLRSEEFNDAAWTKHNLQAFGSGSVANATIAPNGTLTADRIVENTATAQHMVYYNSTPEIGKAYVFTFYAKAAERTFVTAAFSGGGLPSDCRFGVNLNTGEIVSGSTSGSPELTQVTPIGDGWYRIALIKTMPAASALQPRILMSTNGTAQTYLGDGTSGIFLWGAQLEQSSTVGEYIPTTSTINSAPRFDHNPTTGESLGLLVEEQRTNLILQSEDFSTTWGRTNFPTITTNTTVAPDGTTTADTLSATATNSYFFQSVTYTGDGVKAYSVFIKAGTSTQSQIQSRDTTLGIGRGSAIITWSAGVPSVTVSNGSLLSIIAFPNGWYRLNVATDAVIAVNTNQFRVQPDTAAGTGSIIMWGFQAENGAFPTSYIPTTTATATRSADVASITGSNFGVSRTNLLLQSNGFDTTWTNTNTTELATQGTSPDGSNNAWRLTDDSTNATHLLAQTFSWSAVTTTFSIFAKYNDHRWISIRIGPSGSLFYASFDLLNGTAGLVSSGATSSVQSLANGWMRLSVTATLAASGSAGVVIAMNDSDALAPRTYSGTGTSLLIYGAQLETGSAATAYIPTTSAAVTVVDSPWYRQDEGTVFASSSVSAAAIIPSVALYNYTIHDGSTNNRIAVYKRANADTSTRLDVTAATVSSAFISAGIFGQGNLIASAIRLDDFAISLNGAAAVIDTAGNVPLVNQMNIGSYVGATNFFNGTLKRLTYWPQRLPNNVLQSITQ